MKDFSETVKKSLLSGGVGIIPTDTLYGLIGRADRPETVERIYKIRKRSPDKPCIILISSVKDLEKFGVELSPAEKSFLKTREIWPGKVSVVLSCPDPRFEYLTRGTKSLAFRIPAVPELRQLIQETGPLVAPSANFEGEEPAKTIDEARAIFGDLVDFYVDGGTLESLSSTLIKFENEKVLILREGAVKIAE